MYETAAISNLHLIHEGKVRRTYSTNTPGYRLIECTDRISTHNIVHSSEIPLKGWVLNALSIFWFVRILGRLGVPHHMAAYGQDIYNFLNGRPDDYPVDLPSRAIIARDLDMIPAEIIFRNYLGGSLWDKFYSKGIPDPYGLDLLPNLRLMSKLDPPVFTPTDKSETDEPLFASVVHLKHRRAVDTGLVVFERIRGYLNEYGIELVDSKFEFGIDPLGRCVLGDEVCTPDSSRFCDLDRICLGENPPWMDKQKARDYAELEWKKKGGLRGPITFPPEIIASLSDAYATLFRRITRTGIGQFQKDWLFKKPE